MLNKIDRLLDRCRSTLGDPLHPNTRKRLKALLLHPTMETWKNAHGVVIAGVDTWQKPITVWQAVLAISPNRNEDELTSMRSALAGGREQTPDTFTLYRAIESATRGIDPMFIESRAS